MPDGIELGKIEVRNKILFLTCSTLLASLLLLVTCQNNDPITAPTGLRMEVVNDGGGDVDYVLSWNEVPNADYYWIEMDGGDGGGTSFTYYNYYTLEDGLHSFRVKAVNYSNGESSPYSSYYNYTVNNGNGGGNGGGSGSDLSAPTGVTAEQDGFQNRVLVQWNEVPYQTRGYHIYRSSSINGEYVLVELGENTHYDGEQMWWYDESPNSENYYKISAINTDGVESEKSEYAYCQCVSFVPTGVTAVVDGSRIKISWNSVPSAVSYGVYFARTPNSNDPFYIESTRNTYYYYTCSEGDYYFKVKAERVFGGSSGPYSAEVYCHYPDGGGGGGGGTVYSPCPVHYTSHTATSTTITLRWTNPTSTGCGTPTSATLRVRNPDSGVYANLQTLSGSATTVSFSYGMWANSEGYVYCGIVTENSAGSSGGVPLVYNWKTNTWYGGNGLEVEAFMEKETYGF